MGKIATTDYFGPMGPDRCEIRDDYLLFSCDGEYRSKIGVSPARACGVLGSFDPDANALTIVQYNLPKDAKSRRYVNSLWEIQNDPFAGDVVNSYNDGEATPGGGQLGPFYEIETSSPAAQLTPGKSIRHIHRTYHFTGPVVSLDKLSRQILGVSLNEL